MIKIRNTVISKKSLKDKESNAIFTIESMMYHQEQMNSPEPRRVQLWTEEAE